MKTSILVALCLMLISSIVMAVSFYFYRIKTRRYARRLLSLVLNHMYIVNEPKVDGLCSFVYILMRNYLIIDESEYLKLLNVIRFLAPDDNMYWFGEKNNWEKRISYLKDLAGYKNKKK